MGGGFSEPRWVHPKSQPGKYYMFALVRKLNQSISLVVGCDYFFKEPFALIGFLCGVFILRFGA